MTANEMEALKQGFEKTNARLDDIEAKLNKREDGGVKQGSTMKFDDMPEGLKVDSKIETEGDKSEEISSWFNKKLT